MDRTDNRDLTAHDLLMLRARDAHDHAQRVVAESRAAIAHAAAQGRAASRRRERAAAIAGRMPFQPAIR
jgi:hypothetical protein